MILWALAIVGMAILSYLADVGILPFFRETVPVLGASLISILFILCGLGMMARAGYMARKGEKEKLRQQLHELGKKIKDKKDKEPED